ncbi:ATP-dependent DNA helicase [Candidatus Woesearchaeota archaeon]|nr:ATP-dependent DNA helicase [Candidatus Woesearchaeota archaeon]
MLFSHDDIRPGQKELIETIQAALSQKKHVLAHAPTGLGKTAAALCPAIELAMQKDLTVFFLTSRHTQHRIVLETLHKLKAKTGLNVLATSLIGKKWMCAQENVQNMPSGDFTEYCKSLIEGNQCEYYLNARGKNNMQALHLLSEIKKDAPLATESVVARASQEKICPYELSLMLAEDSKVIIADYFYIFNKHIRESLFGKIKKKIENAIIIVDEGHNLPGRLRDLLTFRLSGNMMKHAIAEAKKNGLDDALSMLVEIQDVIVKLSGDVKDEKIVRQEQFVKEVEKIKPYAEIIDELNLAADMAREEQKVSHIGGVATFLNEWSRKDTGFARTIQKENMMVTLSNRCLDPAILTKEVFDNCYASIVMSGTLSPTSMFADVLGLQTAVQRSFKSPFPETNRLSLIVPRTTTKFTLRSDAQYQEIGRVCADLANSIGGAVMIFFPSYFLRDKVHQFFADSYNHKVFFEEPKMEKADKQKLLDRFSAEAKTGAVLLGVAAGSFGEGVDLPGVLKGVIVVGLPLDKPDLETTELISYYDRKFGKGWEYAYTLPAMTRCIQNAGRCIRSEKDRGVIVFLDERYAWPRYSNCFPQDWNTKITQEYKTEIARFFGRLF